MNVRRPECEEQPLRPIFLKARLNQTTMLSGVIAAAALGTNYMARASRNFSRRRKRIRKIGMHRDQSATALFRRVITKLDDIADLAAAVDNHVPGQVCDLACPQSGFRRQQDNHSVANRMSGALGEGQEICDIELGKYLGLFAEHASHLKRTAKCKSCNFAQQFEFNADQMSF